MTAFRHGIAVQMGDGFSPLIDGMLEERRTAQEGWAAVFDGPVLRRDERDADLFEALRDWRRAKAVSIRNRRTWSRRTGCCG